MLQNAAVDAMTACCSVVGNRDVEPFVPALISCMGNPAEVAEGIHKLGAITFVQVCFNVVNIHSWQIRGIFCRP
jgi:elongation factor 3